MINKRWSLLVFSPHGISYLTACKEFGLYSRGHSYFKAHPWLSSWLAMHDETHLTMLSKTVAGCILSLVSSKIELQSFPFHISYIFILFHHISTLVIFLSHPIYGKKMSAVEPGFGCTLPAPKGAPEPSRGAELEQSSQPPSRVAQPHVFSSRALPLESEAFGASNLMIIHVFFLIIKNNNKLIHFSFSWFVWRTGHPEFGG